ncbi:transcriptional repressor [Clostridia bacterium]|nr:transcriptional repressor [Clostridia bacterium]
MIRNNFSKKREAIYQSVCSTKNHPCAEWVYNDLKEKYPKLSLGTVYRNLSLFKEQGLIQSVGTVQGQERFDATVQPHPHFICNSCGKVVDLDMQYNEVFNKAIEKSYNYKVDHHLIFFYGLCDECK